MTDSKAAQKPGPKKYTKLYQALDEIMDAKGVEGVLEELSIYCTFASAEFERLHYRQEAGTMARLAKVLEIMA